MFPSCLSTPEFLQTVSCCRQEKDCKISFRGQKCVWVQSFRSFFSADWQKPTPTEQQLHIQDGNCCLFSAPNHGKTSVRTRLWHIQKPMSWPQHFVGPEKWKLWNRTNIQHDIPATMLHKRQSKFAWWGKLHVTEHDHWIKDTYENNMNRTGTGTGT
jgi:hypothetical protein